MNRLVWLIAGLAALAAAGCQQSPTVEIKRLHPDKPVAPKYDRAYYQKMRTTSARDLQKKVKVGMTSDNVSEELGMATGYSGNPKEGTMKWERPDGTLTVHFVDARVTKTELAPKSP